MESFKEKVTELLNIFLRSRKDLFLIDLKVSTANEITVILDGDDGVSLQDCLDTSRSIENNLDRDKEDFSLQVMSAGATEPLKFPRQFKKNIGRNLEVRLRYGENDKTLKGKLVSSDEQSLTLLVRYLKPKEIGKGKTQEEKQVKVAFREIEKAIVEVKY
ncbi:MAG: ribosome assembly cofactor RimP [Bergeyella sp.]|nr:ribosome assembly cofactor RimP [Bergeyella sp.]